MRKKVQKIITFVLAGVMLVTAANVWAADDEKLSEATARLIELEILEDADFNFSEPLTRCDMFCLALKTKRWLTEESFENAAKNKNLTFLDVEENHPAYGQLAVMEQMGLVVGDGDGNLRPDNAVTYDEVITFLVRLLDYDEKLDKTLGFPVGYMIIASETGITKGISAVAGTQAPLRDILIMINNCLDIPLMVLSSFDAITGQGTYVPAETRTLATDILELNAASDK